MLTLPLCRLRARDATSRIKDCAGGVAQRWRQGEDAKSGDLLRLPGAEERDETSTGFSSQPSLVRLVDVALPVAHPLAFGVDESNGDGIDGDAITGEFERQRASEIGESRTSRAHRRHLMIWIASRWSGESNDSRRVGPGEMHPGGRGDVEHARKLVQDLGLPVSERQFQCPPVDSLAGDCGNAVDATEPLDRVSNELSHGANVRHVGWHRQKCARLEQGHGCSVQAHSVPPARGDEGALCKQRLNDGQADSRTATGNDDHPTPEPEVHPGRLDSHDLLAKVGLPNNPASARTGLGSRLPTRSCQASAALPRYLLGVTEGQLRIVQLNAGSLLEPEWERRRHEVVAWIDRLTPDVVCLQEIWESDKDQNTAGWVAEHLAAPEWNWVFEGAPFHERLWPDSRLRFGSAVLSRWPIESDLHLLPVADDPDPFVSWVPWELLHARTAGLDIFSTHLAGAPAGGHHRVLQVLAIDAHIKAVRGQLDAMPGPGKKRIGMPAILCGDLNAEPDSDEVRFLSSLHVLDGRTAFYQDAWRVAGTGPGNTQDWRANPIAAEMNIQRKRIDYVFVGDPYHRLGSAGRVLDAQLAFHEPITGTMASDHNGLVVDIIWPDRPDP